MGDIYVIDVESTGINPSTADILQLTALKYSDNLKEWELNNWYFNPHGKIPFEVKQLTGLDEEYLEEKSGGLYFEEQCESFLHIFSPDNLIVGHNASRYDSTCVRSNYSKCGIKLRSFPNVYDTMLEAKKLSYVHSGRFIKLPELFRMSCEHYNLPSSKVMELLVDSFEFDEHEKQSHNAKYDVLMNSLLYQLMRKNLKLV